VIKDPEELRVGQVVHLYPHTKTAGQECYQQLPVEVADKPRRYWPMIQVKWKHPVEERDVTRLIHKDNIRINMPPGRKEGDATADHEVQHAQVRKIRRVLKPIDIPEGEEQGELF
jgi:hypothetical protein